MNLDALIDRGSVSGDAERANKYFSLSTGFATSSASSARTRRGCERWRGTAERGARRFVRGEWIEAGELAISISRRFPLEEAAEAHRLLESRASTGKVVLLPAGAEERRQGT